MGKSSLSVLALVLLVVLLGTLSGCGSYPTTAGVELVERQVGERTGKRIQWNQGVEEDKEAQAAVARLLADGIEADEAVQVALLNNPKLQVSLEELGIAQADLVQEGLLSLPVFDVAVSFPSGGGVSDLDFGVSQAFVDLVTLRARVRVAEAHFEAVQAEVASEIIGLAGETEVAFFRAQADEHIREMLDQVRITSEVSQDAARKLHEAGNITDLMLANEKALWMEAKAQLGNAELAAQTSLAQLAKVMGLSSKQASGLRIQGQTPEMPASERHWGNIESEAVEASLLLKSYAFQVDQKAEELGIADVAAWFRGVELGAVASREDRQWDGGPSLGMEIPTPPKGRQAVHERGMSELRQAVRRQEAEVIDLQTAARLSRTKLLSARKQVELYKGELLPVREAMTQQTLLEYNAMQVGVFQLLEARRAEIDSRRQYLMALYDYWGARTELETLRRGGRINGGSNEMASTPASSPRTTESH